MGLESSGNIGGWGRRIGHTVIPCPLSSPFIQTERTANHKVPGEPFAFVHDFLVSDNYYVFYLNPIELDGKQYVSEYLFAKTRHPWPYASLGSLLPPGSPVF